MSLTMDHQVLLPGGGVWNGRWQQEGRWSKVINQEDGAVIGQAISATADDVDRAVRAAASASEARDWPLWQRRESLAAASRALTERAEEFAQLLSAESSKPIRDARREVDRAADTLRLSSEQAARLAGETLPFDDSPRGTGRRGWYTREPLGVVAAITSFNDPLNLVVHKVGPALIGGNAVVLKPSDYTPLTALLLAELLFDSGVPQRMLTVIAGTGSDVGQPLVTHPLVDLVSFTGGYETGTDIAAAAGAKKLLMELGGNGPVIVFRDANLDAAAAAIVDGAFNNSGQNCLSVQRVVVHRDCYQELVEKVQKQTESLVVGSKASEETDVGPLIDERAARRVEQWVEEAVEGGAKLVVGGTRRGVYYVPTVLIDVPMSSKVMQQEVFGPVVSVMPFGSEDEAIELANASAYALQAGVFTADIDRAMYTADRLRFGAVMINDTGDFRIDAMPFGGGKHSGIGREGVRYTVESMTEPKIVAIKHRVF